MRRNGSVPYEPWGKPGAGAPHASSLRMKNVRVYEMIPGDELKRASALCGVADDNEVLRRRVVPRTVRTRAPLLRYQLAGQSQRAVDNELRYRAPRDMQQHYKRLLDDLVECKKRATEEQTNRILSFEKKMHSMQGPWGKPGPGGTVWRNPRDIGTNFLQSMGWTDNKTFSNLQNNIKKRKQVILPRIDSPMKDENMISKTKKADEIVYEKLPLIDLDIGMGTEYRSNYCKKMVNLPNHINDENEGNKPDVYKDEIENLTLNKKMEEESLADKDATNIAKAYKNGNSKISKKEKRKVKQTTPNSQVLMMTGGVELVPLIARKRTYGPKTLPSSDVTRPSEDFCQWRNFTVEHLTDLSNQMKTKYLQIEERRKLSAEDVRRHRETWSRLWGRPGHGAPQGGCPYRHNLTLILYETPPIR